MVNIVVFKLYKKKLGPLRESNPGPLAPEARIIPLNQAAIIGVIFEKMLYISLFKMLARASKS
jgi:hypothetical protein